MKMVVGTKFSFLQYTKADLYEPGGGLAITYLQHQHIKQESARAACTARLCKTTLLFCRLGVLSTLRYPKRANNPDFHTRLH